MQLYDFRVSEINTTNYNSDDHYKAQTTTSCPFFFCLVMCGVTFDAFDAGDIIGMELTTRFKDTDSFKTVMN